MLNDVTCFTCHAQLEYFSRLCFVILQVGARWPQQRFEQKRTLTGKLWAMQSLVREAIRKLRESSSFSAEIFLNVW